MDKRLPLRGTSAPLFPGELTVRMRRSSRARRLATTRFLLAGGFGGAPPGAPSGTGTPGISDDPL